MSGRLAEVPPVATVNTIMKAFSSLKRIDEAMELWRVMTEVPTGRRALGGVRVLLVGGFRWCAWISGGPRSCEYAIQGVCGGSVSSELQPRPSKTP